ncbi:fatty acid desaturase [uncultured Sulfitobacter sp.]|uniref:fatty acid desaturase n=1 Tax=uncultured Sulfitobacter sp. TaxID=191468 RepID=UPI002627BB6A|nr:fatty acid desaturase [uncultured Sulfitobacter sp.]
MATAPTRRRFAEWDWPTLALMLGVGLVWGTALLLPAGFGALAFVLLVLALTLHSSLSHELLHGHPLGNEGVETAIGLWQPGLFVPYLRFKRTHLAHHRDANLTDPYDDPESNYLDPAIWNGLRPWAQKVLRVNNTLGGRIMLGTAIGMFAFVRSDIRAARAGDRTIIRDWLGHIPGVVLTLWIVSASPLSIWAYLLACYGAMSVLRIRTFLEHCAHDRVSGRTVIVEDRGPLGFLFLNNNLHVVHHMHPTVAWYRLWPLYLSQRERFMTRNHGYVYPSYAAVFRRYFWRGKDPVAHPLWRGRVE